METQKIFLRLEVLQQYVFIVESSGLSRTWFYLMTKMNLVLKSYVCKGNIKWGFHMFLPVLCGGI